MSALTPKGIRYPTSTDPIKRFATSPSALADVIKVVAETADAAIANSLMPGDAKNEEQDAKLNALTSAVRTRGTLPAGDLFAYTGYNDNGIYSLNSSTTYGNAPFSGSGAFLVLNDYQTPGLLIAQQDNTGQTWFSQNSTAGGGSFTGWVRMSTSLELDTATAALGADISSLNERAVAPMTGTDAYSMLWRDPTGLIAEPAAVDQYGNTPDWVLERWSERMADYLQSDMGIKPRTALVAFGDSMVERYQNNGGLSWTDRVASKLGVPVMNLGKSGQSSTEVAVRTGAVPFKATVAGNTIPASGSVGLTAYTPTSFWRTTMQHDYFGTLAGVRGYLRQNVADPVTFHFWRETPGDPVSCPPGTRFVSEQAKYLKWTPILWMGRNNINDGFIDVAKADIDAVIAALPFPDAAKRFLVFSVCNATNEPSGSTGHTRVMAINAHLASTYPAAYVDVRAWLKNNALAAMGLTPTSGDTTAIAQDRIPPQLMQDNLHITEAAGLALGDYVASVIIARGVLESSGQASLVTNVATGRKALVQGGGLAPVVVEVGDTGWRDVSSLCAEATFSAGGGAFLKRAAGTVWLNLINLISTNPGTDQDVDLLQLALGFRTSRAAFGDTFAGNTDNGRVMVSSGAVTIYNMPEGRTVNGTISWPTEDPWPTTPYGTSS